MCGCRYTNNYVCEGHRDAEKVTKRYELRRSSVLGRKMILDQIKNHLDFADGAISNGLIDHERALSFLREKVDESLRITTNELFSL